MPCVRLALVALGLWAIGCGSVSSKSDANQVCTQGTSRCDGDRLLTCGGDGAEAAKECGALGCDPVALACRCDPGIDVMTDGRNCGVCGHSCLGGACAAGTCQPIELVAGQNTASGIAVDAMNVYWVIAVGSTGSVRKVAKAGGTFETLVPNQDQPRTVASDGTTVYFGGAMAQVRSVPVGGGGALNVAARNADSPVNQIVVDSNYVWWAEHNILAGGTSYVRRIPKAGGAIEPLGTSPDGASDLAGVGDCAYFIAPFNTPKLIRDCPSSAGAVYTAPAASQVVGIKADNNHVYFLEGNVKRIPVAGGPVEPVAVLAATPLDLAIDSQNVYFIEGTTATRACGTSWSIKKAPKNGGAVTTLAEPPQGCPTRLAVDDQAVYWTNSVSGQIMKVAK